MKESHSIVLESLMGLSVAKCLMRLSRVSAGTWQVLDARISYGTLRDALAQHNFKRPASAVHFTLSGAAPFSGVILFDRADIECISRCFTGHSFPRTAVTTPAEEIMLTELGNILLNAITGTLLNALKKGFIPVAPSFLEGDLGKLTLELSKIPRLKQEFRTITVTLEMRTEKTSARSEVLILLPEELALELENLRPPAGEPEKF